MLALKKILLHLLGVPAYLQLLSRAFLRLFFLGLLKKSYADVYFLNKIVKKGDTCIDIGANLGYYTIPLGVLVGKTGKVIAVEPVALFNRILKKNIDAYQLQHICEILPIALGETDKGMVKMGTPEVEGIFRHGYTKIIEQNQAAEKEYKFLEIYEVPLRRPETVFSNLKKLDFIKCDVEGYEIHILPHFVSILQQFKPIVQVEIVSYDNKARIFPLFTEMDYQICILQQNQLEIIDIEATFTQSHLNYYFIPPQKLHQFFDQKTIDSILSPAAAV